jgi:serine/threonine protein kinase
VEGGAGMAVPEAAMTPERWQQITDVFGEVSQLPPPQREAVLQHRCGKDGELLEHVRTLLRDDAAAGDFLRQSALSFGSGITERSHTLAAGDKLSGRFLIVALIGAGGMGEVYRAQDTRLNRPVAIKALPHVFIANQDLRQRMEAEARAIASLAHPHICAVHDLVLDGELLFLVMEYLEGLTLAQRLSTGPMDLPSALTCLRQVGSALDAAHRHQVIHRDLKPANVMLTAAGAKLLDFGIAKLLDAPHAPVTEHGFVIGTQAYMSPEQEAGDDVDARTDVFGFGLLLHETLTGERPVRVQRSHADDGSDSAFTFGSRFTQLAGPLQAIVKICLSHDRNDRFASMHATLNALQNASAAILNEEPIPAVASSASSIPAPPPRRRRLSLVIAGIVVAAVATRLLSTIQLPSASPVHDPVTPRPAPVSPAPQLPPPQPGSTPPVDVVKEFPGGVWQPRGPDGSANGTGYGWEYRLRLGFDRPPLTNGSVAGKYGYIVAVKQMGAETSSVLEAQGQFQTDLLADDTACGGLPAYPGVAITRIPCWRLTLVEPGRGTVSAEMRQTLEAEGLPGTRTISYIVSMEGTNITLRQMRGNGAGLDQNRPPDHFWVVTPPRS